MSATPIAGHYTQAEIDYAATLLTQGMPGLGLDAARKWVTSEQGQNNNVLGVTYTDASGHQQLHAYPTLAAGVAAAIANWNRAPYAAARKALAAATTTAQQLTAIASSPWNHAYYSKVLTTAPQGPAQGGLGKAGVATATIVPKAILALGKQAVTPTSTEPATAATGGAQTLATYLGIPESTRVTLAHVKTAADQIATATGTWNRAFPSVYAQLSTYLLAHPGITAGQFPIVTNAKGAPPGTDPIPSVFGALFGWVPGVLVNAAVLGTVLVLGYRGVRELLPDPS